MSTSTQKKSSLIHLAHDETERAKALAPTSNSGINSGKPSLSLLMREVIELGELAIARGIVPNGQLPWDALKRLVRVFDKKKARRAAP